MNEAALKALIEEFKPLIQDNPDRGLMLLVQEVERTTRGNATRLAYKLAHDLNDLNDLNR